MPLGRSLAFALLAASLPLAAQQPPVLAKSFSPSGITTTQNSELVLRITNPNASDTLYNLTATDPYETPGLIAASRAATTDCPSATITDTSAALSISIPTLGPGASCELRKTIEASAPGNLSDPTGIPSARLGNFTFPGTAVSATLSVAGPFAFTKSFVPGTAPPGGIIAMTYRITNPNAVTIRPSFTDPYESQVVGYLAGGTITHSGCGAITFQHGSSGFSTGGSGSVAPLGTCEISVPVTALGGTGFDATSAAIASTPYGTVPAAFPGFAVASLGTMTPPTVRMSFTPSSIPVGSSSRLSVQIQNDTGATLQQVALSGVSLPQGLEIPAEANSSSTCGGLVTPGPGMVFSSGNITANSSCTVSFEVQASASGGYAVQATASAAVAGVPLTSPPAAAVLRAGDAEATVLVRYADNILAGAATVRITNDGSASTDTGNVQPINGFQQDGQLCANIYTFTRDEQMYQCCSCNVTTNALTTLRVDGYNGLAGFFAYPNALVVKIIPSAGGAACTQSTAASLTTASLRDGLLAWGSHLHPRPPEPGVNVTKWSMLESPFLKGKLTEAELNRMRGICAFIRANGSGYGYCKCNIAG